MKALVKEIFEAEMLMGKLLTILLQIICKQILNFKVIIKSIINPDDTF